MVLGAPGMEGRLGGGGKTYELMLSVPIRGIDWRDPEREGEGEEGRGGRAGLRAPTELGVIGSFTSSSWSWSFELELEVLEVLTLAFVSPLRTFSFIVRANTSSSSPTPTPGIPTLRTVGVRAPLPSPPSVPPSPLLTLELEEREEEPGELSADLKLASLKGESGTVDTLV